MGIKYICDVCAAELNDKGLVGLDGHPASLEPSPGKWAVIIFRAPEPAAQAKPGQIVAISAGAVGGFLVCSPSCAEKALDEIKGRICQAFEEI